MAVESRGGNLIFLISQPRAGSTLLQRILGSHPEIHTVSEPWLMLHPLYATRAEGIVTEYQQQTARVGVSSFVDALPGGRPDHDEGLRRMYAYLYDRALQGTGRSRFLDKTPRYYMIIPDLLRIFPEARFILLFRNPLAVLASVLKTWVGRNPRVLQRSRHDLRRAPALLLEGVRVLGDAGTVVHYERLVADPTAVVRQLCESLGLSFDASMINYADAQGVKTKWVLGDQETTNEQTRPQADRAERWKSVLVENPQYLKWAKGYLRELGPDTVRAMGYDYEELSASLRRPTRGRGIAWIEWKSALKLPGERNIGERTSVRILAAIARAGVLKAEASASLKTRGFFGTLRRTVELCWRRKTWTGE